MKRLIHLLLGVALSSCPLLAQYRAQGIVEDTQGKPIEYVNVVAMRQSDSTFVSGNITDARGKFKFDNLPERCYLLFSSIGYKKQSLPAIEEMRIVLQEEQTTLSEVSITARSLKERLGGYSIQIQNNPFMRGKTLPQALELLPLIHLEDEKVSILNRAVEAIYVDGLRLHDQRELGTLPIEQVERIEVDYTSSAREGANATGGVIRIYLKKQARGEWSANIGAETLYMPHYGYRGGNANNHLSLRWDKLTLRNALNVGKQLYLGDEETSNLDKRSGVEQRSLDEFRNWKTFLSNRLSLSYQLAPKHLLASSIRYSYELETPEHTLTDLLSSGLSSYQRQHNPRQLWQWLVNYKWTANPRTTLSLSTDLLSRHTKQSIAEQQPVLYTARVEQQTDMLRIKPELQHQLKKAGTLTLGGDLQWIRQNEETTGLVATSMRTSTHSLFSIFSGKMGKLRYELGVRLQSNETKTTQAGRLYRHSYASLYPSLSAMYLIDPKRQHIFNLQVKRVMETIPYSAISGYRQYEGTYAYSVGNPDLRTPTGTQAMALLSLWGSLNFSLGLVHYESPIYFERKIDDQQAQTTYTTPMNGSYQLLGIGSVEWRHKLAKWWSIKTSAMLRWHSADAGVVVRNQVASIFRHNSSFAFTPSFGAALQLVYEPTFRYLDRTMNAVGSISADVYKSLLNGKLDIRCNATIYRKERSSITANNQLLYQYNNLTRSPSFSLSISYRLSGKSKKIKELVDTKELQNYQKTEEVK